MPTDGVVTENVAAEGSSLWNKFDVDTACENDADVDDAASGWVETSTIDVVIASDDEGEDENVDVITAKTSSQKCVRS